MQLLKRNPEKQKKPADKPAPKRRVKKWMIIFGVILAVILVLVIMGLSGGRAASGSQYTYATAEKRDITTTITGSGALKPADSYTVTTLTAGNVLSADFNEGDVVTSGQVLYQIDNSNTDNGKSAQDNLNISAPLSGQITELTVKEGDSITSQTALAVIENTSTLTLTEYYSKEYAGKIYTGMPAAVSIPDQTMTVEGAVSAVSTNTRISDTGISCFAVTISISNPGSLTVGLGATCWLTSKDGTQYYPVITDDDGFDASSRTVVRSDISGTIEKLYVRNNENARSGQLLLTLNNDNIKTITAPINGTIVSKFFKAGETTETGSILCTIYDLSYLELTLNVDELDVNQVKVGQTATITADAVQGKTYEGTITKVGINGTTTNGVTTYPVSIRIDQSDRLLPAMNVDVSIIVKQSKNVLAIPADAVANGKRVLVKTEDGSTDTGAPSGYKYVQIETGTADNDYVEVTSGLKEGDTIAYTLDTSSAMSGMFGAPGAGMAGGAPGSAQGATGGNQGTTGSGAQGSAGNDSQGGSAS